MCTEKGFDMEKMYRRGWIVTLKDGTEMKEWECSWNDVPKNDIAQLALIFEGRVWKFHGKSAYIQRKRGSVSPGEKVPMVEKRVIGYYEDEYKVEYIVDERTGVMEMKVVEVA